MGRVLKRLYVIILLLIGCGAVVLWLRVENRTLRVLQPVNTLYKGYSDLPERAEGVQLTPFEYKGYDGSKGVACLVTASDKEGGQTPRQQALLEKLLPEKLGNLNRIDYAFICAGWDHGIRAALPLAETLAAAGISCVLWEPRGKDSVRKYSTRGLLESKDVPLIMDALQQQNGRDDLFFVGVGEGYGAELLLHAAAREPRLRAVVSVDACSSLSTLLKRSGVPMLMRELIGRRMQMLTGLEPFDIAAVKSVFSLYRRTPVLFIFTDRPGQEGAAEDSLAMHTQLHPDQSTLATIRRPDDPPDATSRQTVFVQKGDTHEVRHQLTIELLRDADEVPVMILRWMNQRIPSLLENTPATSPSPQP